MRRLGGESGGPSTTISEAGDPIPDVGERGAGLQDFSFEIESDKFTTNGGVSAGPVIDQGVVLIGYVGGDFAAVDAETLETLWTDNNGRPSGFGVDASSGVAYYWSGDIKAVDIATGNNNWTAAISTNPGNVLYGNGKVFVTDGFDEIGVYAYDAADGTQLWKFDGASDRFGPRIRYTDGVVYAPSYDGTLYAVDEADGTEVWSVSFGSDLPRDIAPGGENIYLPLTSDEYVGLDKNDGSELWRTGGFSSPNSAPGFDGGRVYAADDGGTVYALDESDGSVVWSTTVDGQIRSNVTANGEFVYTGDESGGVYALNAANGTVVWEESAVNDVGGVGVAGDDVWIGSDRLDKFVQSKVATEYVSDGQEWVRPRYYQELGLQ